ANDGRELGKVGVADALRNGEAGDGDPSKKVIPQQLQIIPWKPLEDRHVVLDDGPGSAQARLLQRHAQLLERILREERLLQIGFQRRPKAPPIRQVHLPLNDVVVVSNCCRINIHVLYIYQFDRSNLMYCVVNWLLEICNVKGEKHKENGVNLND
ncbi:hypothetical protein Dimus_037627, partial [Dionaea muscipula]